MKVIVTKSFGYSADGIRVTQLKPDPNTEVEIKDDLVPGLCKEGFVKIPAAKASDPGNGGSGGDGEKAPRFIAKHIGGGRYQVLDAEGKPQHEGTLSKADAEKLGKKLTEAGAQTYAWLIEKADSPTDKPQYFAGWIGKRGEPSVAQWDEDADEAQRFLSKEEAEAFVPANLQEVEVRIAEHAFDATPAQG